MGDRKLSTTDKVHNDTAENPAHHITQCSDDYLKLRGKT